MRLVKSTLLIFFLFCNISAFSQAIHTAEFTEGAVKIKFVAAKANDKYSLKIDDGKEIVAEKKDDDLQKFYHDKIKESLEKKLNSQFGQKPQLVITIENFAKKFSQAVLQKTTAAPANESKIVRSKPFKKYELLEFQINEEDFIYALIDSTTNGGEDPITVLQKNNGVYQYDHNALNNSNFLKDSIVAIAAFIAKNAKVKTPQISTIKLENQPHLYLVNDDGTTDTISISANQAAFINKETEKKKTETVENSSSENAKETQEKKPEVILDAQPVICNDKNIFNIVVMSYVKNADSMVLDINTSLEKKKEIVWKKISAIEFKRLLSVHEIIRKLNCDSATVQASLDVLYGKLEEALKAKKKEDDRKESEVKNNQKIEEMRTEFNNRLDKIAAEKDFAALLDLKSDTISLHSKRDECGGKHVQGKKISKFIVIDSITIRISHNIIYQIDIIGTIDQERVQTSSNHGYGINLRGFMDAGSSISYPLKGTDYWICYSEIFLVRPTSEDAISYNLRDGVFHFVPKRGIRQHKLEQKRLLDFVSASVFLDLQAFNANNPNKNLLTELYFTFNINSERIGVQWLKKVIPARYTYTNLTMATNLFKESNIITTYRHRELINYDSTRIDTARSAPFYRYHDSLYTDRHYLKNFDLIKYSFFQIRPVLNIFSVDWKQINTFIDVNLGAIFMGSNARITDPKRGTDSISSVPVFSYSGMVEGRIRINPKVRYGIDFHVAYVPGLKLLDDTYKSITGPYAVDELVKARMTNENKKAFYQAELNFYFNPKEAASNTDRGGIYFKLNWFKSVKNSDGHVMFLVGYSSDIKNFFK